VYSEKLLYLSFERTNKKPMKLKANVDDRFPEELVRTLNAIKPHAAAVLQPFLKNTVGMGPAEFFVQHCDLNNEACAAEQGCVVILSQVSITDSRAPDDFRNARAALANLYIEAIQKYIRSDQRVQMTVSIHLDGPLGKTGSNLVEGAPVWFTGLKQSLPQ